MIHYTELFYQLKASGFNVGMFDDETKITQTRIYMNGYGENVKVYLFVDEKRRQNNFSNPISGYGLHVGIDIIADAKSKMLKRCKLKHQVMTELFEKGFALKPVTEFRVIGL